MCGSNYSAPIPPGTPEDITFFCGCPALFITFDFCAPPRVSHMGIGGGGGQVPPLCRGTKKNCGGDTFVRWGGLGGDNGGVEKFTFCASLFFQINLFLCWI